MAFIPDRWHRRVLKWEREEVELAMGWLVDEEEDGCVVVWVVVVILKRCT